MRKLLLVALLALLALVLSVGIVTSGASAGDAPERFDVDSHLAQLVQRSQGNGRRGGPMSSLDLVKHVGMRFPNSDVWSFGDFAYVGTWGYPNACPETGIKIVDISNPSKPRRVGTIPSHPGTRANDVKVAEINIPGGFSGVLLAHSDEPCDFGNIPPGAAVGFHLWNVTNPTAPIELSEFPTGPVHNLYLFQMAARAYVLLAIPFSEVFGPVAPFPGETSTDFAIVEVTVPTAPVVRGTWTAGADGGFPFGSPIFAPITPPLPAGSDCSTGITDPDAQCRGDFFPANFLHDVWASSDGQTAYLSYWDLGLILLDISTPGSPTLLGRGASLPAFGDDEGDLHAAVPNSDGSIVVATAETFRNPETGLPARWGVVRIFDTDPEATPTQISAFATDNALNKLGGFGFGGAYSAHNIVVRGTKAYLSWYSDGIRIVDISDPTAPVEIDAFSRNPLMWGVYEDGGLIFGSDIDSGFYILEQDS